MALKIKLKAEKRVTKDGVTFIVYRILNKDTKHYEKAKFTRAVKNAPEHSCYIYVPEDQINYDRYAEYPTWWIREVTSVEEFKTKDASADEDTPF